MPNYDFSSISLRKNKKCLLCKSTKRKKVGIKGNREYTGADKKATPHLVTDIYECSVCNFNYIDPFFENVEEIEKIYYGSPDKYFFDITQEVSDMFQKRVDLLQRFLRSGSGLDVGCGRGEFLKQLNMNGFNVQGIEPSEGLNDYASQYTELKIHHTTLENFNGDEKFDFVSSTHSLEHMDDPHSFIENTHRVLKEKGILFLEVPNTNAGIIKLIDFIYNIIGLNWTTRLCPLHEPFHKYGYNKKSLEFLVKNKFKILHSTSFSSMDRGARKLNGFKSIFYILKIFATMFMDFFFEKECLVIVAERV